MAKAAFDYRPTRDCLSEVALAIVAIVFAAIAGFLIASSLNHVDQCYQPKAVQR